MEVSGRRRPLSRIAPIGLAISLAAQGACGRASKVQLASPPPAPSVAERVRVLNADVIVVDGVRLRLANAFAPQPLPYARCWAEALAAVQATRELRSMVAGATHIEVRTTGERDQFNRPLAYVRLDRLDLGDTLYARGLAARRTQSRFRWCAGFSEETNGAPPLEPLMDLSR